jgi:hypothetical protein
MKNIKCILSIVTLTILLGGCSGPPSERDGRKLVEEKIKKEAEGRIRLASFSKSDGQHVESSGVQIYVLAYTIELEFTEDCYWGSFAWGKWSGEFFTIAGEPDPSDPFAPAYMGKVKATKGSRTKIDGTFTFMKSEKGWNLVNL